MDKRTPVQKHPPERTPSSKEDSLDHIKDTGLPPGIEPADVIDPGNALPKGRTDNRS